MTEDLLAVPFDTLPRRIHLRASHSPSHPALIEAGRTISYAELARRVGRPRAVRAAGLANGRNPISIVVPCHRVIGSNGSLTGYGGGLPRKKWLLEHEGALG